MGAARIVEVSDRGRRLSLDRGFMVVHGNQKELGRIAIDDVSALMLTSTGVSYSNPLLVALAERGAVVAVCGAKYLPVAWMLPVVGHYAQTRIMSAQAGASKAINKRIWQMLIKAKIRAQSDVLDAVGAGGDAIRALAARVGSGDPKNVEAQAAVRYWPSLFGADFRRDRAQHGTNELLNYGYTVLRSATARAIVAAGLHPSIGVRHRRDPLALTDDLMEPLRPLVDLAAHGLVSAGATEATAHVRQTLVGLLTIRLEAGDTATDRLRALASAVATSYLTGMVGGWGNVARGGVRSANDNNRGEAIGGPVSERPPTEGI